MLAGVKGLSGVVATTAGPSTVIGKPSVFGHFVSVCGARM
jgi:hypothetical protein